MTSMNMINIIKASEKVAHRCTKIAGTQHGSTWLADKLIRYFEKEPAAESITFDVFLNAPVMMDGEATIHRDGRLEMRTVS